MWRCEYATGTGKINAGKPIMEQIDMFRENGQRDLDTLLLKLSRDPDMIY